MVSMSGSPILPRVGIVLFCAVLGSSLGTLLQALRITGRPQEFRSLAKLVAGGGGNITEDIHMRWRESQMDFYGTIIETIESAEMKRRALERVRALHPELKEYEVEIRVSQTKGSTIFNILATGAEPKYTNIYLDSLLDEFIAFRQNIGEQSRGKTFQQLLQEVVSKQKIMEDALARMEQARSKVESLEAKAEQERRVARMMKLRDQRDDLRLEIKALAADETARAPLEAKLGTIELAIQTIGADLQRYEVTTAELRVAVEKHQVSKLAYEKLFEQVEKVLSHLNTTSDYVVIQERATPASENVEDWRLPIAIAAGGGGFLGAVLGLLLSLIIVRSTAPVS